MKMLISTLAFLTLTLNAFASSRHDYQCIADKLQAYNSDLYYDLTPAEIDAFLSTDNDTRAPKVRRVAKICDSKNATIYELYQVEVPACIPEAGNSCQGNETEIVTKSRMKTELELVSQDESNYTLKTTKTTRWSHGSKFIDIRTISIDFFDGNDQDALVTITEASANGMGSKTTRLIMSCKKAGIKLSCEQELKDSVLKLTIGE